MLLFAAGVVVGFAAATALLDRELPEDVPEPLRAPLETARERLRGLRALAREALDAARAADEQTRRDLEADYRQRTHRD